MFKGGGGGGGGPNNACADQIFQTKLVRGERFFIKIGPGGLIFGGDQNFRDSSLLSFIHLLHVSANVIEECASCFR